MFSKQLFVYPKTYWMVVCSRKDRALGLRL